MNLKEITLNGKSLSEFTEGKTVENPCFKMNGKAFKSVYDLKKGMEITESTVTSQSVGTESYHYEPSIPFIMWTDGISQFIKEENAVWLLTLVASYAREVSDILATVSPSGEISYKENPRGKDNFLYVSLTKGEDNDALFTIEHDCYEDGEECVKALAVQYIPYTDISESVFLYLEDSVLLFPSEH